MLSNHSIMEERYMSARYHDKVVANAVIGTTESEAWAIGKRDGVDVTTTDPVYKNNSKYYASQAGVAATNAASSASTASSKASAASTSATNAASSASTASSKASAASASATNATNSATAAKTSETNAANSAKAASDSATGAASSATAAKTSETNAANSAKAAASSALAAKTSETSAASSASTASSKATAAAASQTAAKTSETNAASSASTASSKATAASTSATNAKTSEKNAKASEDNAADILEQCKAIVSGVTGALIPKGTIKFVSLPAVADAQTGWLYNISDAFTTTASFEEGAGIKVAAGSNVYMTANNKWDVLVGAAVVGVKGNAEGTYRTGQVNLTPANLGAMTSVDPVGTGSFSMNRKAGSEVGHKSFAEGYDCEASESSSHAEGGMTKASGVSSHAEGQETVASGEASHAEGYDCTASNVRAHAEGESTVASGVNSHAEGTLTKATAEASHAEGILTKATAEASHTAGVGTTANYAHQFVVGQYNKNKEDSLFEVGNGIDSEESMSNAFRVTKTGEAIAQTALGIGDTNMTESQLRNLLVADGVSRFDGIVRFIGSPATDNSQVYNEANVVAVVMNPATDNKIRAGYGFHNARINGLFLYLDIDGYLKMLDTATCVVPKGNRVYAIGWKESETSNSRPQLLVDGTTWVEIPTYNEISTLLMQSPTPFNHFHEFNSADKYADPTNYRYLLYNSGDSNFAGIGFDSNGNMLFRTGTSSASNVFKMLAADGVFVSKCVQAGNVYMNGNAINTTNNKLLQLISSGAYVLVTAPQGLKVMLADASTWGPVYASAFTQQSSKKYKQNIVDMAEDDANKLLQLRPVQYDYINELDGTGCYGLIAEEVDEVMSYPVVYDADGNPNGIDYSKFAPYLIKKVQMQEAEIDRLKKHTADLEERLKKLEDMMMNK